MIWHESAFRSVDKDSELLIGLSLIAIAIRRPLSTDRTIIRWFGVTDTGPNS